jgi:FkbM family methyltransferase
MRLPSAIDPIRQTHFWQKLKDWRYLHRHRALRKFYGQFVRPGSLVFDIGANVGHYALIFRSLGAQVVAVEPQASLVGGLRWRFSGHKNLQIVQAAVGATHTTATLHKAPDQSEIASLRTDVGERSRFAASHHFSETETVPVVTLDSLLQQFGRPDFCKIDVEGFECEVLAGLSQPLPLLSLEFNREFWNETKQCLARLGELGDYQFNYMLGEIPALGGSGWMKVTAFISELEASKDPLLWGDLYARLA